jgi:RHS repeat-associated protein
MSTSEEGNVDEEAGFTGKDYDADVEMTYFNARWYDPELGRFVEEDPMADDPNLYSYGFNSPLNYMDPTGMFSVGITGLSNGNYLQFAGAVVGAIGQLNPKYADICSAFGAFLSIVDNRQQVAKAKIAAEKAAEQEAELSANIITAGIDRHKSNPKNDGSFSVDILDTSEANDDTLGVEVEILPGGYTRVEAEEAIPLDLGLDLNLYNTEDNGAGFFNDSLIENSNDWIAADVTYYNQHDSPWGDDLYSIKNDWKNQTFSKSGCGPTAAAMAISTQLGIRFTPDVAGQFSLARGYRTLDSGTNPDFFQPLGKACGLNVIATTSFDQLIYYLGKGGTAVVSMKPGDFTTGGHYIVLSAGKFGTNNGSRLFVSDPNKREKTKYWNSSVIKKQMKGNYYIFISDERLFTSSFD